MRKNRMMRAASALLVAVLLTTSTISGTFAKYVTTASGSDTARVAKWGVEVSGMASDLFKQEYDGTVEVGAEVKDLVAPGTKNDEGVSFSLTGTPEVAVNVKFEVTKSDDKTKDPIDVVLPAKDDYKDWTKAPYDGTFDLDADYHPVVFKLVDTKGNADASDDKIVVEGTLAELEAKLESLNNDYDPNEDLGKLFGNDCTGNYKLTWVWGFENTPAGENVAGEATVGDEADTYLGNVAAGIQTDASVSTTIDFAIAITVTQID